MVKSGIRQVVQGGCTIMTGTGCSRRVILLWMYAGRHHWIIGKAALHAVFSNNFVNSPNLTFYMKKMCISLSISLFFNTIYMFAAYFCFSIPFISIVYSYFSIPLFYFLLSSEYLVSEYLVTSSYPSSCHHVYVWYVLLNDDLTHCFAVVLFILTSLGYMVCYIADIRVKLMRWI